MLFYKCPDKPKKYPEDTQRTLNEESIFTELTFFYFLYSSVKKILKVVNLTPTTPNVKTTLHDAAPTGRRVSCHYGATR